MLWEQHPIAPALENIYKGRMITKVKEHRMTHLASMIGLGMALGLGTAAADIIEVKSKIISINAPSNYLKVDHLDRQTDQTNEIRIDVERGTLFNGITSLADLKVGDDVSIRANYSQFTHEWKAQSIGPYNQ